MVWARETATAEYTSLKTKVFPRIPVPSRRRRLLTRQRRYKRLVNAHRLVDSFMEGMRRFNFPPGIGLYEAEGNSADRRRLCSLR